MSAILEKYAHNLTIEENGCITWHGSKTRGRPTINVRGTPKYVCRLLCEERDGPAPLGHEASHICNRGAQACVNPDHLLWETKKENEARKPLEVKQKAWRAMLIAAHAAGAQFKGGAAHQKEAKGYRYLPSHRGKKWQVRCGHKTIGYYSNENEAREAYVEARAAWREKHGL